MSEEVTRILGARDHYEVLTVAKEATQAEIKKAYRKIALLIHPDRCHDPRATQAFQKFSHSYQILSDPEKRRDFDRFGDAAERPQPQQAYQGFHRQEMTPEDLFTFIFNMDPRFRAPHQRPRAHYHFHQRQQPQGNPLKDLFVKVLPLLLVGVFSAFQRFGSLSNKVDKKSVKDVLSFEEIPSCITRYSKTNRVKYYLPQWWVQQVYSRTFNRRELETQLDIIAEQLWKEELDIQCELEKNRLGKPGEYCRKARSWKVQ